MIHSDARGSSNRKQSPSPQTEDTKARIDHQTDQLVDALAVMAF